jgi:putative photosynthetic complex assembly protein 2
MAQFSLAVISAVLMWWLSTGIIFVLGALPRYTFAWSMLGATVLVGAGAVGLLQSATDLTSMGAYVAFLSALSFWGWIEMSFLLGFVTGPRKEPCPPHVTGWARFLLATQVLLYHELAIIGAAIAIVALTWGEPNQTGTLTFLILMGMRISAKLNIFLGVPNLTDEFMPAHLAYLKTYFRKKSFNALFPVSVAVSIIVAVVLGQSALNAQPDSSQAVGASLLLTLVVLALLEHLFMILPLRDAALWRWAVPAQGPKPGDQTPP